MELVVIRDEYYRDSEGYRRERLLINGKEVMSAGPFWECPEDATLERDLLGPSDFADLLERIIKEHNGKKIKFEYAEVEEFE